MYQDAHEDHMRESETRARVHGSVNYLLGERRSVLVQRQLERKRYLSTNTRRILDIASCKYSQRIISSKFLLKLNATWKSLLYAALPVSSIAASRRDFLAHIRAG